MQRMTTPRWRLAVHGHVLRGLAPAEALSVVRDAGYEGIFWQLEGASIDNVPRISGVEISGVGFAPDERNPVAPERAAELADALGARVLRVVGVSVSGRSYADAFDATLRLCEAYSQAAQRHGLRVLLHQRWGTLTASASQLHRVLSQFDPGVLGCIYDAGSMTIEGYEEYRIGLEILGSYVADVHIANTRHFPSPGRSVWEWEWSPLSDGLIDLTRLFRALRRSDYQGWVTLADRSQGRPPAALLEADRRMLEQAMGDFEGVGSHNPCRPLDDHVDLAERVLRV
jgi:sugar phosphate isomerase/epimerase